MAASLYRSSTYEARPPPRVVASVQPSQQDHTEPIHSNEIPLKSPLLAPEVDISEHSCIGKEEEHEIICILPVLPGNPPNEEDEEPHGRQDEDSNIHLL